MSYENSVVRAKMKIVIIGAGVAGLSTYLLLKKHLQVYDVNQAIQIVIYEAYDIHKLTATSQPISEAKFDEPVFTPVALGNALGVSRNGLSVLSRMDKTGTILSELRSRGNPVTKWRMTNARGWDLVNVSTGGDVDSAKPGQAADSPGQMDGAIMIARQDLWEVIRNAAVKDGATIYTKRVSKISIGDDTTKNILHFDDGTSDQADLVIGADGLRSCLRRAMFERQQPQTTNKLQSKSGVMSWVKSWSMKESPSNKDYITPQYEGLGGLGGFIPTKELQDDSEFDPKTMNIVFGRNGFFGYGCISSPPTDTTITNPTSISAWWSTFSSPIPYPYHLNPTPSNPSTRNFDAQTALQDLLTRHQHWHNATIQKILQHTSQTGLPQTSYYPTWTTPELPYWSQSGRTVLVGDAAHALQPSSGQGASQALEDAEALALLLSHHLKSGGGVSRALELFEALRRPRVSAIYERSQKMGKMKGDMGIVMEMVMYFFIWVMGFFNDKSMDGLVNYDLPREVEKVIAMNRVD